LNIDPPLAGLTFDDPDDWERGVVKVLVDQELADLQIRLATLDQFALHSGDARGPMAKQFPYGADELLNGNGLNRLVYGLGDPIPI
jgi:hypothetical protein